MEKSDVGCILNLILLMYSILYLDLIFFQIFEKFVAFIHIGEAAVTVRNAILKYSEDPDLVEQFRIFTNMSANDFYTFKREISELIKARNILAHLGNNEIENFDAEKLKEDFEKLELTTNSVFNKV